MSWEALVLRARARAYRAAGDSLTPAEGVDGTERGRVADQLRRRGHNCDARARRIEGAHK